MTKKIKVQVIANSSRAELIKIGENEFKARVDEVPEKGKANKRLIEILADYFKISKSKIEIVSGKTSNHKIVEMYT